MTQTKTLQNKLKWPGTTMLGCLIDNPDFTGKIIVNFNQGGVTSVDVTKTQNKPPDKEG